MVSISDVVSILVKQTKSGETKWDAFHWDDGVPGGWSTNCNGCRFSLINNPVELSITLPDKKGGLIHIGKGQEVQELLDTVASLYWHDSTTKKEAIEYAYGCLSKES